MANLHLQKLGRERAFSYSNYKELGFQLVDFFLSNNLNAVVYTRTWSVSCWWHVSKTGLTWNALYREQCWSDRKLSGWPGCSWRKDFSFLGQWSGWSKQLWVFADDSLVVLESDRSLLQLKSGWMLQDIFKVKGRCCCRLTCIVLRDEHNTQDRAGTANKKTCKARPWPEEFFPLPQI